MSDPLFSSLASADLARMAEVRKETRELDELIETKKTELQEAEEKIREEIKSLENQAKRKRDELEELGRKKSEKVKELGAFDGILDGAVREFNESGELYVVIRVDMCKDDNSFTVLSVHRTLFDANSAEPADYETDEGKWSRKSVGLVLKLGERADLAGKFYIGW